MGSLEVASSSSTSCRSNSRTWAKYGRSVQDRAISRAWTPRLGVYRKLHCTQVTPHHRMRNQNSSYGLHLRHANFILIELKKEKHRFKTVIFTVLWALSIPVKFTILQTAPILMDANQSSKRSRKHHKGAGWS